jgi:hypothetical protein
MTRATLVLAALALTALAARADYIVTVTVDTTALANNPSQGPFFVNYMLQDFSSGDGVNNNTAIINHFNLHGGSLTSGTSISNGSLSGDLSSSLTITDNSFGRFLQQFTPGSSLSFTLDLTTNVSTSEAGQPGFPGPDQFQFEIFSPKGVGITLNLSELQINITGPSPEVLATGGSLPTIPPTPVPAPVVTAVPEPSSLTLLGMGAAGLVGYGWWQRKRVAA